MNFTNFQTAIYNQSMEMQTGNAMLFQVTVDKDEMWQHYLNSFPLIGKYKSKELVLCTERITPIIEENFV